MGKYSSASEVEIVVGTILDMVGVRFVGVVVEARGVETSSVGVGDEVSVV